MARPGDDLVPRFECLSAAEAGGVPADVFDELPVSQQAEIIAWHRARGWLASLEAYDASKRRP